MGIQWNPISDKSSGGTELLCRRLEADLPEELMKEVQIVPSRLYGELDQTKVRILYLHDLPNDPESQKILANRGWEKFHMIVCVSNWQMQHYIAAYQIPWSKCMVIPNSIDKIDREHPVRHHKTTRFIYHTTPHRGLDILYAVFDELHKTHERIHLDVYSSFEIYGWGERDEQFKALFENIRKHPAMTYHGSKSNEEVRKALSESDVFAYPSTWPETSCLSLIEAMSAGLFCAHPNFGALYETSANWTSMYQFQEDPNQHAGLLHGILDRYLHEEPEAQSLRLKNQKAYADIFYSRDNRKRQWEDLIRVLLTAPREFPKEMFHYKVA